MLIRIKFFNFNSHAHVERDSALLSPFVPVLISTHTLTWSVTVFDGKEWNTEKNFNSHAHVERDSLHRFSTLAD